MTPEERSSCAALAAWLRAAATLGPWSLLLAAGALAGWFWLPPQAPHRALLAGVLLLALLQRYLQLRIVLDRGLFAALAGARITGLAQLDAGLQQLRLRPAAAVPRPLAARAAGTGRLVCWQCAVVLLQTAALALALMLS